MNKRIPGISGFMNEYVMHFRRQTMLTHTEVRKGRAAKSDPNYPKCLPLGPSSSSPSPRAKDLETGPSAIHEGLRLSDRPAVLILSHTVPFSQDPEFAEGWLGQGWVQIVEEFVCSLP